MAKIIFVVLINIMSVMQQKTNIELKSLYMYEHMFVCMFEYSKCI